MSVPRHIAIIMDGNGRWAEHRHLPRIAGHQKGVETVRDVVSEARRLGVGYLTLYAFSSENWGRPAEEVNALMGLLGRFLNSELPKLLEQGIRLEVIGDLSMLPGEVRQVLEQAMTRTARGRELVLTLALSYGGRNEILRALRRIVRDVGEGCLDAAHLEEEGFARYLDTGGQPDPDLLIRTSGEMRISNFLLWQLAYAELYFTETLWPDFGPAQLRQALAEYSRRQRRFGLTPTQLAEYDVNSREGHH